MEAFEANFDGLIGPTHNYSGLSFGNVASMQNRLLISNPKQAALQGLEKMRTLMQLGLKQGILPPHERPYLPLLNSLGYSGSSFNMMQRIKQENPILFSIASSAASMWAANAATVTPSADSEDKRVHFTPANLISQFHRSFEAPLTALILKQIFKDSRYFIHHNPLPSHPYTADEGAANHTRFCASYREKGVHLFVFGKSAASSLQTSVHFPARQTLEASQAVARLHQLNPQQVIFAQQNPLVIDSGVFHNDVIAVGNQNVFFYHEQAFVNSSNLFQELQKRIWQICETDLISIPVLDEQISIQEAVKTYLFNSQLISLENKMVLIAPHECQYSSSVQNYLQTLIQNASQPIRTILYQDVHQSMQNGGGPACLRLRVTLNEKEWQAVHPEVILTDILYERLKQWIQRHYRDKLSPEDLFDPQLLLESQSALDELSQLLKLGSIYSFQRIKSC